MIKIVSNLKMQETQHDIHSEPLDHEKVAEAIRSSTLKEFYFDIENYVTGPFSPYESPVYNPSPR